METQEKSITQGLKEVPLAWREALRAFMCMFPALVAGLTGNVGTAIPMGQAGFFYVLMSLPETKSRRLFTGSVIMTVGLGFYLIGGNVVFNPWLSLIFTFFVAMNIVFLTSWKSVGLIMFSLLTIYSAGLNASSPEKVHATFMAFCAAFIWSIGLSMLPIFKGESGQPAPAQTVEHVVETGIKMGIGTSVALFIGNVLSYSKLGWPVSAVSNIVRFDEATTNKRAAARFIATIGGAIIAGLAIFRITDPAFLLIFAISLGTLNGLLKKTKIGKIPLLYTATILILYSINDAGDPAELIFNRIAYNLVGIAVGVAVMLYPFPILAKKIKMLKGVQSEDVQF